MAIHVNVDSLLHGKGVEWERLDFKKGWNPEDVMHTICAFANDIHNWGGGYVVVGVEEVNGVPVLPPRGVDLNEMDDIQKQLVRLCKLIQPNVNLLTEPVMYQGKRIFIIHVPGGELRPYKAPISLNKESEKLGKVFWVRQSSVTRRANEEEERILMSMCNKVPFDDRIDQTVDIEVLDRGLIADYLKKTGSRITFKEAMQDEMESLGRTMNLISGPKEFLRPKNIGLLLFTPDPEQYIPYARIEIVRFKDEVGDRFDEQILHGPMHMQLKSALDVMKSLCVEKVMKVKGEAEAVRRWNYPYAALEEVVANACYHKAYDEREPIVIRINLDSIEVLNMGGPMPPITAADLKKQRVVSLNYRNRRIGEFLKDLHFTEGRSTGFPKIYRALKNNDSPMPTFETDEYNTYFRAILPIHQAFVDDVAYLHSIGKEYDDGEKGGEKDGEKEPTDRQRVILSVVSAEPAITRQDLANKTGVSPRTIDRELAELQRCGMLVRRDGKKNGWWEVRACSQVKRE